MGGQQESDREYPQEPVEGVGGVIFRGDRVLLVRRAKPPRQGAWSLPGGAREPGESPEETFSRELREETGLELAPAGFVETVEFIERDDAGAVRYYYSLRDYWAESDQGEARPGDDVSEVVWAPLEALDPYELWDKTVEVIHKAAALREAPGGGPLATALGATSERPASPSSSGWRLTRVSTSSSGF